MSIQFKYNDTFTNIRDNFYTTNSKPIRKPHITRTPEVDDSEVFIEYQKLKELASASVRQTMIGIIIARGIFYKGLVDMTVKERPHWLNVNFTIKLDKDRNGFIAFI